MEASPEQMAKYDLYSQLRDLAKECDPCRAHFYSPMNYDRHTIVKGKHGRGLDKEEKERRAQCGKLEPYWNKLNAEEQKQFFLSLPSSVNDLQEFIEEHKDHIECILNLKNQFLQKKFPFLIKDWGFFSAASVLLEFVQSYRFPINFKDLSSILEGASEQTFLLGDYSKVEQFFKQEDDDGKKIINAVARTSFEVERKLCELVVVLEKKAEASIRELLDEDSANKKKKKKKPKKRLHEAERDETPPETKGEETPPETKGEETPPETKGEETPPETTLETQPQSESTPETHIEKEGDVSLSEQTDGNEQWDILDGVHHVPDAPLIDIVSLFETNTLRMTKLTIPVWKKERFHFVYQEMLRAIVRIISRLKAKGITTGSLDDDDVHIISGSNGVVHRIDIVNNIELDRSDQPNLQVGFKDLVLRLVQSDQKPENTPPELSHFLCIIELDLSREQLEKLVNHPWLMPFEESFFYPLRCWLQLHVYDSWKQKLRDMAENDRYHFPNLSSEVYLIEDPRFLSIYNYKDAVYEDTVVGVLDYWKNVLTHFTEEPTKKCGVDLMEVVDSTLSKHFPNLKTFLFDFFMANGLNLHFMRKDK